ncbi:zinc-ribbon domain-containing protein [Curtobacterium sp. SAFR-003]|uniref:zinc-ribbon domain-containing protein n=1 Tax=Curtobacterium sp. SAFR-003 TaxID=3387276 RepID=UPI003F7E9EC6
MIRCEHCGSMLPDGAIFCGECGRSVTVSANRRPAPVTLDDHATPPPLQQPGRDGTRTDPASDAWLPEATLDPATRAWLTGADRAADRPRPTDRGYADEAPRAARPAPPAVVPTSGQRHDAVAGGDGFRDEPSAEPDEPALDPDAYPAGPAAATDVDELTARPDVDRPAAARPDLDRATSSGASTDPTAGQQRHERSSTDASGAGGDDLRSPAAAPAWSAPAPAAPVAPSRPSWWIGREPVTPAAVDEDVATTSSTSAGTDHGAQPGDTAVVEPLVDRRPPRPTPLVTPGSGPTTCHVCGHTLEPDDIFCAECGAVRPAVTAAFTGPVVPLPIARPDWAATDRDELDTDTHAGAAGDTDDAADAGAAGDAAVAPGVAGDTDHHLVGDDRVDLDVPGAAREHEVAARPSGRDDGRDLDASGALDASDDLDASGDLDTSASLDGTDDIGADVDETPRVVLPPLPPVPGAPAAPPSAPQASATWSSRPPTAAPLPPLPGSTGPVLPPIGSVTAPTSGDADEVDDDEVDDDEDVEETRIVAKHTSTAPFVLHFSTGERIDVHGSGLLGRLPRPQPAERFDELLTIHDPGKSVSKTHLEFGRDGDDLWVSDRASGNGTVIRHIDGSIRRCEPGRRYRVERGARVDIGEQFFLVQ